MQEIENNNQVVKGESDLVDGGKVEGEVKSVDKLTIEEKLFALVSYVPMVFIVSLMMKPESLFVRSHVRQGVLLTLILIVLTVAMGILGTLPFGLGVLIAGMILVLQLGVMVLVVYSMYLAVNGVWWRIPLLGKIADMLPVDQIAKVTKELVKDNVVQVKNDYESRKEVEKSEQINQ